MAYFSTGVPARLRDKETLDRFWACYPEIDQKTIQARIIVGRTFDITAAEYAIMVKVKGLPQLFTKFVHTYDEDLMTLIHSKMQMLLSRIPSHMVKCYRQPPANWRFN